MGREPSATVLVSHCPGGWTPRWPWGQHWVLLRPPSPAPRCVLTWPFLCSCRDGPPPPSRLVGCQSRDSSLGTSFNWDNPLRWYSCPCSNVVCVWGFLLHQEFGDTSRVSDPVYLDTASDPSGSRFSPVEIPPPASSHPHLGCCHACG